MGKIVLASILVFRMPKDKKRTRLARDFEAKQKYIE